MEIKQELIAKAKTAKNAGELMVLAQAEGVAMTEEKAQAMFARLHPPVGELADEELEAVAGGGCGGIQGGSSSDSTDSTPKRTCPRCGSDKMVWMTFLNRYWCADCGRAD